MILTPPPLPGKYETEAMRKRRDELHRMRRSGHFTVADVAELDWIVGIIGDDSEVDASANRWQA